MFVPFQYRGLISVQHECGVSWRGSSAHMLCARYCIAMESRSFSRVWVDLSSTNDIFSLAGRRDTFRSEVIMFEAVLVSNDGGTLTSTLINLSEVSVLDGSIVTCTVTVSGGAICQ